VTSSHELRDLEDTVETVEDRAADTRGRYGVKVGTAPVEFFNEESPTAEDILGRFGKTPMTYWWRRGPRTRTAATTKCRWAVAASNGSRLNPVLTGTRRMATGDDHREVADGDGHGGNFESRPTPPEIVPDETLDSTFQGSNVRTQA